MSTPNPAVAKRFKASSYSGSATASGHALRLQAAINDATAYVAANPQDQHGDLLDPTASLYSLQNKLAKAAAAKAGPSGFQCVVEDDIGGELTTVTMQNNVHLEFSKDVKCAANTTVLGNFINVDNKTNFTITSKAGAFPTARPTGPNAPHSDWSVGKAIIDLRGHQPGTHPSGLLGKENIRFSWMDGTNGGGASHFKFSNMLIIGNNDCAAPGWKQDTSFFTPLGGDATAGSPGGTIGGSLPMAAKYGIWIDLDFDGCYSGFGGFQISSIWRCLLANNRSHGGTMWRNESDAHYGGAERPSYGVSQVDFIAGYGEDMNKVLTMQPNLSKNFVSWYVDGIYGVSCLETANSGQFLGSATADQSFSDSFWGEIWGVTGEHSAWQESSPCMVNDTAGVYAQITGGHLPGSIWGSVKHNFGHRGGPGHGADGGGAEIPFKARGDGTKTNGTRDPTMNVDTLRARWASKKIVLGTSPITVPGAPILTGPASPQTAPYTLIVNGAVDKTATWEWRLTTDGVAGAWSAITTTPAITASKTYAALGVAAYVVEARCTNSAGTGAVSAPFSLAVNTGGGVPSKAVIASGPAAQTTLSTATFVYSAASSSSLETSLDGAAFATHASPRTETGLGIGIHTYRVQGVNVSGIGPMSDTYSWEVIDSGPVQALSAIQLVGTSIVDKTGEWAATASTNLVIPFPSDVAVGDFMLLIVGWGSADEIGVPTGWQETLNSPVVAGTTISLMVAQRIFSGTEGAQVTVTGPNTDGGSGVILAVSGAYSLAPTVGTATSSSG